jgi:hypothetical protein
VVAYKVGMTDTTPQGPCASLYNGDMTALSTRVARARLPVHGKRSEGELQPIHFQPSRTVSGPSFRGAVLFAATDNNFSEPQKAMKAVRARFPRALSVGTYFEDERHELHAARLPREN